MLHKLLPRCVRICESNVLSHATKQMGPHPPNKHPTHPQAKAILLTAFLKLDMATPRDPALTQQCEALFAKYASFMDAELQQRALEYGALHLRPAVAQQNLQPMPKWEKRRSLLLRKLDGGMGGADELRERPGWMQEGEGSETPEGVPTLAVPAQAVKVPQPDVDLLGVAPEEAVSPAVNGTTTQGDGNPLGKPGSFHACNHHVVVDCV